jgi:hypothetical protein
VVDRTIKGKTVSRHDSDDKGRKQNRYRVIAIAMPNLHQTYQN